MSSTDTLELSIKINAPLPIVWMAFANEEFFGAWYAPEPDWSIDLREFSFEEGGKRVIAFGPEGEPPYVEEDRLLSIDQYKKIVFMTSMYQADTKFNDTHCTLTFSVHDEGTQVHLIETGVVADVMEPRRSGWVGTFENLNRLLQDDGEPQIWHGTFAAPIERVWQAFTQEDDIKNWFAPFPGSQIEVHECGYGVGQKRSITFGKGEDWEHTIIETFLDLTEGEGCVLAVDMIADGYSYSTLTGTLRFVGLDDGKTSIFLAITGGPPQERAVRAGGWGMTLNNLASVL